MLTAVNRTCAPCSSLFKCLQCTDGPVCTLCQAGFYLNSTSSQCLPCHFPCTECSIAATNCTKCPPTQLYSLNSNACNLCYQTLPNCVKCDMTGTKCFQCNSTKTFLDPTSNQCTACIAPCLDCTSSAQCLSCAAPTHLFAPSTFSCELCSTFMPRCASCIKAKVCTACETTATYFLTYPPGNCSF